MEHLPWMKDTPVFFNLRTSFGFSRLAELSTIKVFPSEGSAVSGEKKWKYFYVRSYVVTGVVFFVQLIFWFNFLMVAIGCHIGCHKIRGPIFSTHKAPIHGTHCIGRFVWHQAMKKANKCWSDPILVHEAAKEKVGRMADGFPPTKRRVFLTCWNHVLTSQKSSGVDVESKVDAGWALGI